jgi:tRNA(Ile2) C34 agmatinyltransferase TiaS
MDQNDLALVESLRAAICPSCGGPKGPRTTFCGKCYFSLPRVMQHALYRPLGSGYTEAVAEAQRFLKPDVPQ